MFKSGAFSEHGQRKGLLNIAHKKMYKNENKENIVALFEFVVSVNVSHPGHY